MAERAQIAVSGVVQGVGFRPYVHALATGLGMAGFVTNTSDGVIIDAEGENLPAFIARLRTEAPPLSRITQVQVTRLPLQGYRDFTIRPSRDSSGSFTLVSPDASICPDCLRELLDPADRRYRYPFINCTNCGPRYSITRRVPYDRPNTTMSSFVMCADCEREYHDSRDRRFHAQPNACPVCGPRVRFIVQNAKFDVTGGPLDRCIEVLKNGGIVAVKGIGGFHIACDATNDAAVHALRERKRKSKKPFAVMARSLDDIRTFCMAGDAEQLLLESVQRPIVLLQKREGEGGLSAFVSPNNKYIGCMLPYTPLHYLLFSETQAGKDGPALRALVMTSGNLAEEPIAGDNGEAVKKLSSIVDAFLVHDRDIFMRVDDSVLRLRTGKNAEGGARNSGPDMLFIRRSRGFAPEPLQLDSGGPEVLGCGADLKNTFTLTKGAFAIPSQHIGDMENYETLTFFEECLSNLKQVYRAEPTAIVHDLHPGYLSTRWALEHGTRNSLPCHAVQHHYAHIGSVMAEQGLRGPLLGIAFDGTGYGTDGNLWGGEFLLSDIEGFERIGQFRYLPLPGGEAAIREPWRTAVSAVMQASPERGIEYLRQLGFAERYGLGNIEQAVSVSRVRELSPLSSGAGRLFDAVSALLGICGRNTFEGEAAMALEALVLDGIEDEYPVDMLRENGYTTIDYSPLILSIIEDAVHGVDRGRISTKFHNTVAGVIAAMGAIVLRERGLRDVAMSGGTFQNCFLMNKAVSLLEAQGMRVHVNRVLPPNDACISLGQAYLIRERLKKRNDA